MSEQEVLAIIIGRSVALFPSEIAFLLQKNAVVIDAQYYNVSQLVESVVNGISSSESFRNDFGLFVENNKSIILK